MRGVRPTSIPADGEQFWLADDHRLALVSYAGEVIATIANPLQSGPIGAAHGSGSRCVAATNTFLYLAAAADQAIVAHTMHLRGLVDVTGVFEPGKYPAEHALNRAFRELQRRYVVVWR